MFRKNLFLLLFMLCLIPVYGFSAPVSKIIPISSDRVAIGGIQPGSTKEHVRAIYGEPNHIRFYESKLPLGDGEEWKYGTSFCLDFVNDELWIIKCTEANGLKTPDGIGVGARESDLQSAYGRYYRWGDSYWFRSKENGDLVFQIKNGTVSHISAGFVS